jgi:Na+/H+-dicarboxylate symporter/ABC-type amino acid transport substrate-binding protein
MAEANKKPPHTINLQTQVAIGAVLGIVTGLFFGDAVSILAPIGTIYTMLLQAVVYPYIICTLLTSLGRLTPKFSLRLLQKSWLLYGILILLTFFILISLGNALPITITATKAAATPNAFSELLALLIPQNFFTALANNYVPAVVIFCILFGITLQFVTLDKTPFFQILEVISKTCLLFWNGLVKLAPVAIFALLAETAGTIRFSQLADVSEYLILFLFGILILVFWLIPICISASVGITYGSVLKRLRDALIISVATTLSVVALPYIYEQTIKLLREKSAILSNDVEDVANTTLMVSYPLGQLGNFFVYLFILFASLYFDQHLTTSQHTLLSLVTYLSSIGSPSTSYSAVTFLSNWLSLPPETTALYVSLTSITRYGQVLASVMGFAFLTILISFAYVEKLKIAVGKIIIHLILIGLVSFGFVYSLKGFIPDPSVRLFERLNSTSLEPDLTKNVKATIITTPKETGGTIPSTQDALFRIQQTGVLRVGYNADMRPFVFFNKKHELVGFDVAYAYALAQTLNSRIEFIPFTWQNLIQDFKNNRFDIAIGGIYVTEQRLKDVAFTEPYFRSQIALIVPKTAQTKYQTANQISSIPNLRIGTFNDPVLIPYIQTNFPRAKIVILSSVSDETPAKAFAAGEIDILLWSEAQTKVWALGHPGYISIAPSGLQSPFLMAYMINQNSPQFLHFLNYWMELKKNDGFQQKVYNRWILIRPSEDLLPRWSIMRTLMHH